MPFDWLSAAGPLIQGGGSLASMFMSPPENPYLKQGGKLISAASDPNNRRNRNLSALIEEQQRGALMGAINDLIKQNARSKAKGSVSFGINPERRDESRTMALLEAFARAKQGSRMEARDTLMRAGERLMQGAYAGADLNNAQRMNQQNIFGSLGGLADILAGALRPEGSANPVFNATGYQTNTGQHQLPVPKSVLYNTNLFSGGQ